ncbi:raffinose/stachyose/melibiose transport system permease protein [Microbacterium marinum]|jgi:raffinose/stachyose/melibiose transport system permease protein|uniref:Raffinose/stachyose/melibiose transport system permease protein n=1 Tax=Microbacterium marinum TaxID=421115 RepID=A0A7W7BSZ3_9MICO|nr:carbohydrate ABC transporter permease [Microbacterium marinum]MBB4668250.1 raffinose/stachyose/melibiose transport system permease protein [Microbacterium marinum]
MTLTVPKSEAAPRRRRIRHGYGRPLLEVVMVLVTVAYLFPLYIMLTMSFKTPVEIAESSVALPKGLFLDNYATAWSQANLGRALLNSALITSVSITLVVIVGAMAGYAIARGNRRTSTPKLMLFMLGLMIPGQLGMVPLYNLMRDAGLLQSYWSLIIFYAGSMMPLTVFLYTGFLRAQSSTYEEAARIDGAGWWRSFWHVVFPLLRPVTGTVIIVNAINIWNDFLTPLLYVSGSANRTLPVAVFSFQGEFASEWGLIFAGMVIAALPVLIVYFFLQRHIIHGFAGGLKG